MLPHSIPCSQASPRCERASLAESSGVWTVRAPALGLVFRIDCSVALDRANRVEGASRRPLRESRCFRTLSIQRSSVNESASAPVWRQSGGS